MARLPNETMQQYRGRQKRETNAANDALNLQPGDPILFGTRRQTRYREGMLDRRSPTRIIRLEGIELQAFLIKEDQRIARENREEAWKAEQKKFRERPEVQDAEAIRYIIESEPHKVIDLLTPAEWAEFRKKLES